MNRPPYTFAEMLDIERHADRVLSAAMTYCDGSYYDSVAATRFFLHELRHAAGMLKDATDEDRKLIANRLLNLFKERPNE